MLSELSIRDVVLIHRLDLNYTAGLSALTGETGAGKSILLDAMGLALGARAEASLVRKGAEKSVVTATFSAYSEDYTDIIAHLRSHEIDCDDGTIILKRTLGRDGRSKAYINDTAVSISFLREVGDRLVDIHGQFDTHGLMDARVHGGYLDRYARAEAMAAAVRAAYADLAAARGALKSAQDKLYDLQREEQWLRDNVETLGDLDPQEGEEDALHAARTAVAHREAIIDGFGRAHAALDGEGGALGAVNGAIKALGRIADKAGEEAQALTDRLDAAYHDLADIAQRLGDAAWQAQEGGQSLSDIDDRLHALRAQARKHRCTVDQLPGVLNDMRARLDLIDHQDDRLGALEKNVATARAAYLEAARDLSARRKQAAEMFDEAVQAEFAPLKLSSAQFRTMIEPLDEAEWGPDGADRIAFCVRTNAGSDFGPLDKTASGGELSRIMLALKVVLSAVTPVPVMIFDEVDSGMGGATADALGERLARLSADRQVLVVTHSPQIAARAQNHWVVSKTDTDADTTETNVVFLDTHKRREEEIARMLSGAQITAEARAAAGRLLEQGRAVHS